MKKPVKLAPAQMDHLRRIVRGCGKAGLADARSHVSYDQGLGVTLLLLEATRKRGGRWNFSFALHSARDVNRGLGKLEDAIREEADRCS